jgi:DNA-directed RNA polymerase specialized sigma subunit
VKSDPWLLAVSPAIEVLDERQLMLVELSYRHGLTHRAIAAQLETARSVISTEIATVPDVA